MKLALIVGIDFYQGGGRLHGCVNDAYSVESMLKRHDGGAVNFECKLLTASGPDKMVTKTELKKQIKHLFAQKAEIALLYFAGHGHLESTGGYIIPSDARSGDDGISLSEILILANDSPATNKIILLDSCHSGFAGSYAGSPDISNLKDGLTIMTASTSEQYASEIDGSGVFTSLMVDALSGSAANLVGKITPGSIYAHIDQSLGGWDTQRPVFKTNVKNFVSLREVAPPIALDDLRAITTFFPNAGFEFQLDPSYEPEMTGRPDGAVAPDAEHTRIFGILQQYNRLNLLVPIDAPHMWHAAIESRSCRLTALGEHYRRLVEKDRLGY